MRLCDRGPSGFELTEAGRVALDLARDALKSLERIGPEIDAVRGVLSGTLTIGMSEQIMQHADFHLSEALARCARRHRASGLNWRSWPSPT